MTSTSSAALAQPPLRSRQAAAGHRHRHRPLLVPLRPLHALLLALALALHLAAGDWAPSASFAAAAAAANPSLPPPPFTRALAVPRGGGLFGRSGGDGGGPGRERRGGIGGGRFGRGRGRGRRRGAAEKGGGGGATEGTGGRGTNDGGGGGGGGDPPPPPEVPVYPALTTEEIVDVLNVPVYAITDRHGNGAVLTAPAGTDASAVLGDGGSSSDGNEGGREDGQDGMGGTRTGGKEGTDGTDVVYFFLSRRMAAMALRGLLRTNEGLDLRVTPLHLGKVWFHLMEGGREGGEGAALEYEAQVVEKLLALTLKAAKDLHKVNGKAMITFESPRGEYAFNLQAQNGKSKFAPQGGRSVRGLRPRSPSPSQSVCTWPDCSPGAADPSVW